MMKKNIVEKYQGFFNVFGKAFEIGPIFFKSKMKLHCLNYSTVII